MNKILEIRKEIRDVRCLLCGGYKWELEEKLSKIKELHLVERIF